MAHPSERPRAGTPSDSADGLLARIAEQSQIDFELGFFAGILRRLPGYIDVLRLHAKNLSTKGLHRETLDVDRLWVRLRPDDPLAHYNLACSYALNRHPDKALAELRRAVECGYRDFRHMRQDGDLESIRHDPRFRQLLREYGDL